MIAVGGLAALVWWWWPTWSGQGDDVDVLVVTDDFLSAGTREMGERIREDGFAPRFESVVGWCDVVDAVRGGVDADVDRVVVSVRTDECAGETARTELLSAVADRRLVVVVAPGDAGVAAHLEGSGAVLVHPERLLGPDGTIDQPCQWWDDCRPDGLVAVRDETGRLTDAGVTRVARMTVTALR
jgi:hypothetical protein